MMTRCPLLLRFMGIAVHLSSPGTVLVHHGDDPSSPERDIGTQRCTEAPEDVRAGTVPTAPNSLLLRGRSVTSFWEEVRILAHLCGFVKRVIVVQSRGSRKSLFKAAFPLISDHSSYSHHRVPLLPRTFGRIWQLPSPLNMAL